MLDCFYSILDRLPRYRQLLADERLLRRLVSLLSARLVEVQRQGHLDRHEGHRLPDVTRRCERAAFEDDGNPHGDDQ